MSADDYVIRTMTRPEVDLAADWAAAEGWNPGLYDAEAFYAADPGGFMIGLASGRPVATISMVIYDDSFAFGGFYIVRPEARGRGYGRRLRLAAMARAENRTVGLDGVVAQQDNYARYGFVRAFNSFRYQSSGGGVDPGGPGQVVDLGELPWPVVEAYDLACFPAPRPAFLRAWINLPESFALGLVQDGALRGYGVLRRCRTGFKIGPLFADDPAAAARLLSVLSSRVPGQPVWWDVPLNNPAAKGLAESRAMTPVFETARMYLGGEPRWDADRIYGITSFELG